MLGWAALGAVVLQGILGGLRVTLLKDQIGIFHACLAQAFFALLVFLGLTTSKFWTTARPQRISPSLFWWPLVTSVLIYGQLALGATMRHQHQDLAILDFPAAYGQVIPDTTTKSIAAINQARDARALSDVTAAQIWLQLAHRAGAALIFCGVLGYWFVVRQTAAVLPRLRVLSNFWALLIFCQITLGAWVIWSNKAADIATAHVAVGATTLAFGVAICAVTARVRGANLPAVMTREAACFPQEVAVS